MRQKYYYIYKILNNFFVFDKYNNNIVVFADFGQVNFLLDKTPLGETRCLSNPYFLLTGCLGIQFLIHSPFPTQSVRLPLVTYPSLCSTCVTYRTLCHAIGHQVLPTQPLPREVDNFSRGGKYFKHVPPLTYLIYFSPKGYT